MNQQPPIRKPRIVGTREASSEPEKRRPVQVRSTFVRLSRQPVAMTA